MIVWSTDFAAEKRKLDVTKCSSSGGRDECVCVIFDI